MRKVKLNEIFYVEFRDRLPLEEFIDEVDLIPGNDSDATLAVEWELRRRRINYNIVKEPNEKYSINLRNITLIY